MEGEGEGYGGTLTPVLAVPLTRLHSTCMTATHTSRFRIHGHIIIIIDLVVVSLLSCAYSYNYYYTVSCYNAFLAVTILPACYNYNDINFNHENTCTITSTIYSGWCHLLGQIQATSIVLANDF